MESFTRLMFGDQILIVISVFIVILAIAIMIVVGSDNLKRWFGRRLYRLSKRIEAFNDKYFSDDEPYDAEWMDEDAWKKTRI